VAPLDGMGLSNEAPLAERALPADALAERCPTFRAESHRRALRPPQDSRAFTGTSVARRVCHKVNPAVPVTVQ